MRISTDAGEPLRLTDLATAPAQAMWFLAIVSAVLASAGEFQHRTIRTTLLAAPHRGRLLAAKGAVAGAYGGLLVLRAPRPRWSPAWSPRPDRARPSPARRRHVGAPRRHGRRGGAVCGARHRSRRAHPQHRAAIAAVLLWRFVGEGILPAVLRHDGLTRWTPNGAAGALVGLGAHPLAPGAGGLLLAGYTGAISAVATALFLRRDPT